MRSSLRADSISRPLRLSIYSIDVGAVADCSVRSSWRLSHIHARDRGERNAARPPSLCRQNAHTATTMVALGHE
jgi:hypothetical protein